MLFRVSGEGLVRKDYLHNVQSLRVKKYRHAASGIGYFGETVTAIPKYIHVLAQGMHKACFTIKAARVVHIAYVGCLH